MGVLMPFVIAGIVSGSVYGFAGVGLVLTYKTSGVFNFAYGAIATASAYIFYTLYQEDGIWWPISAAISVVALGAVLGIAFDLFTRRLVRAPVARGIAGTVGIVILVQAGATLIYGVNPLLVNSFLPQSPVHIAGLVVTVNEMIIIAIGLVVTGTLFVFLHRYRIGIAMRAIVDNPSLLSLSKFNPDSIRRTAWIIGCCLATLSGVLLAPSIALSPTELTLLSIQAFGAAAIGQFVNLPLTYVGGLLLGVASSLATHFVGNSQDLAGLPASLPFIVLFVALIASPKGRLLLSSFRRVPLRLSRVRMPGRVQAAAAAPVLVLACFVPLFLQSHLLVWTDGLAFTILFASMVLLIRVAGQVSLCHVAFAAIGASTFARLAGGDHWPWLAALIVAALCVVPVGALLAVPASRLPVLYLGVATLGFGFLLQQLFYTTNLMFTPLANGLSVGRPRIGWLNFTSGTAYYYLVLVVAVLCVGTTAILIRGRLGRVLAGLSDSPRALNALGADERVTRMLVFCLSAFFAAIFGGIYASLLGNVSSTTFDPSVSLTYFVLIVIVAGDVVWASLGAAIGIAVIPGYIESGAVSSDLQVVFGVTAIVGAASAWIPSLPEGLERRLQGLGAKKPATLRPAEQVVGGTTLYRPGGDLELRDITVSFGGVRAVNNVSLTARAGAITGLIGPNGAGKTTIFNVCSGLQRAAAGGVFLGGTELTGMGSARRARLGLGRSFQQTELFSSLTVLENVALGREAALAGANPVSQVLSRRSERGIRSDAVVEALEVCDLTDIADVPASTLSSGQRRIVEFARCLASPGTMLLLDEPSAGLDTAETRAFISVLSRVVRSRGLGILLVEHDMDVVMTVCEYVYVLDFGQTIFSGEAKAVQASPIVQAAYLGESFLGAPAVADEVGR